MSKETGIGKIRMPSLPKLPSLFKKSEKTTTKSPSPSPPDSPTETVQKVDDPARKLSEKPASVHQTDELARKLSEKPPLVVKMGKELSYDAPKFSIDSIDKISNHHPELNDFKILKIVGKGGFAKVYQAIRKNDGRIFALKVMRKDLIKKMRQATHVMNEKNILLSMSECKFLVHILSTFQDAVHLFMIQEYLSGGDLFSYIKQNGHLTDKNAQFYAAEVFLGLEFLHKHNVVYRDLKPENILFDAHGHIRIADLGFAKKLESGTTTTFCGTPSYLAPEILQKKPYSFEVDWWAFGIIIFQLCSGCSPFQESQPTKTFARILHCAIRWPPEPQLYFTNDAFDIITQLLELEPEERLLPYEIRAHEWFEGLDWPKMETREIRPPECVYTVTKNRTLKDVSLQKPSLSLELSSGDFNQSHESIFDDF